MPVLAAVINGGVVDDNADGVDVGCLVGLLIVVVVGRFIIVGQKVDVINGIPTIVDDKLGNDFVMPTFQMMSPFYLSSKSQHGMYPFMGKTLLVAYPLV